MCCFYSTPHSRFTQSLGQPQTECIYRHLPATFDEARTLIDNYIYFYNNQRIQLKTGVAPLMLRHSA
ncbi:IS3 family transposase [Pseudoflavonifractor sp. P01025]|uniref:IS3 family transposase n=1 Tax=Flintibacter porci TaxID=3342383 RepID=UPI0035B64AB3